MSGQTVSVRPGAAQQLTNAPVKSGTSLFNTDTVNGVWIGSTRGVAPGLGQFIGPQGSAVWTNDKSLIWACVDTGVISLVNITVSDDIGQVDNPVAVGVAVATQLVSSGLAAAIGVQVATQLLNNGVPNVLKQDSLVSLPGGFTLAPGAAVTVPNIGKYASLVCIVNCISNAAVQVDFDQNTPFNQIDYLFSEFLTHLGSSTPSSWVLPVNAQSANFTNVGPNALNLIVYGTNRAVPMVMQLGKTTLPRRLIYSGATVNGTTVVMATNDGDISKTRFNRSVAIRIASASIGANFGYQYIQQDGTLNSIVVGTVGAGLQSFAVIAHPTVPCQWFVTPTAAAASTTFTLDITWQGP